MKNVARRVEQIVNRPWKPSGEVSLAARVIELLVLEPRTTPQGLVASLRQQTQILRKDSSDSAVERIVEELIAKLELQARVGVLVTPPTGQSRRGYDSSATQRTGVPPPMRLPHGGDDYSTTQVTRESQWVADQSPPRRDRPVGGGTRVKPTSKRTAQQRALANLVARFPWPQQPPSSPFEEVKHFTQAGTLELLEQSIDELQPTLIVEVGAWLGGSTRWLLNHSMAAVVSIDTWLGSIEHQAGTAWHMRERHHADLLDHLFETFLHHCWEFRERLIPLRTSSLDGFWQIASAGLHPDLILLDGAHDEISVTNELELAHDLFPNARLIIDDYNRQKRWLRGLVRAVDRFAGSHGLTIVEAGGVACMLVD